MKTNTKNVVEFDELLRKIYEPLLRLGCDIEQFVRELFEPLVIQIIHWYSNPNQNKPNHIMILIEILMVSLFLYIHVLQKKFNIIQFNNCIVPIIR